MVHGTNCKVRAWLLFFEKIFERKQPPNVSIIIDREDKLVMLIMYNNMYYYIDT